MTIFSSPSASLSSTWGLACLLASGAYALSALMPPRWTALRWTLRLAWLAQGVALVGDIVDFNSSTAGARFGFAPALSLTVWMVIGVLFAEDQRIFTSKLSRSLSLIALILVVLAWIFPGQHHLHLTSPYEPLHWIFGLASYGLFAVAVVHALLGARSEKQLRNKMLNSALQDQPHGMPLLRIENLTFRFVELGFGMLTLTLLMGAWFAHPWRWDHKTVFSLLAWCVFLSLLLGRKWFGWRGKIAARWLYTGSSLLLLAYVGSRFVFEVILHRLPNAPF